MPTTPLQALDGIIGDQFYRELIPRLLANAIVGNAKIARFDENWEAGEIVIEITPTATINAQTLIIEVAHQLKEKAGVVFFGIGNTGRPLIRITNVYFPERPKFIEPS